MRPPRASLWPRALLWPKESGWIRDQNGIAASCPSSPATSRQPGQRMPRARLAPRPTAHRGFFLSGFARIPWRRRFPCCGFQSSEAADKPVRRARVQLKFWCRSPHAQVTLPFFSRMTTEFKNSTPLRSPSFGVIRLSSCSMESVPSYPQSRSVLMKSHQKSAPCP